ncbi:hypothetical protein BROUX41_004777 [Berkeleyomyces rouxiae]
MARLMMATLLLLVAALACAASALDPTSAQRPDALRRSFRRSGLKFFQPPTEAQLGSAPLFGNADGALPGLLVARADAACSLTTNGGQNFCFASDTSSYCPSCGTCCSSASTTESLLERRADVQEWCCGGDAVCCDGGKCCPSGGVCCAEGCCNEGQQCVAGKCMASTGLSSSTSVTKTTPTQTVESTASEEKSVLKTPSVSVSTTAAAKTTDTDEAVLAVQTLAASATHTQARTSSTQKSANVETTNSPKASDSISDASSPTISAASSAATTAASDSEGLPIGATVGILISCAAVVVVIIFILVLYFQRRMNDRARARAAQMSMVFSPSSPLLHESSAAFGAGMASRSSPGLTYTAYPPYAVYHNKGSGSMNSYRGRRGDTGTYDRANGTTSRGTAGRISRTGSAAAGMLSSMRAGSRSDSRRSNRLAFDDRSTIHSDDDDDAAEVDFAKLMQEVTVPIEQTLPRSRSAARSSVYSAYPSSAAFPLAAYDISKQASMASSSGGGGGLPIAASMMTGPTAGRGFNGSGGSNAMITAKNIGPTPPARAPSFAASAVAMERGASTSSTSTTRRARSIFFPAPHHDAPFSPPPPAPAPRPGPRPLSSVLGGVGIALSCDEPLYSPLPKASPMSLAMSVSSVSSAGTGLGPTVLRWSEMSVPQQHQQQQQQPTQGGDSGIGWNNPTWGQKPHVQLSQHAWSYAPNAYPEKDLLAASPSSATAPESGRASPLISPRTRTVTPLLPGSSQPGIQTPSQTQRTGGFPKPHQDGSPGFIAELEGSGPLI